MPGIVRCMSRKATGRKYSRCPTGEFACVTGGRTGGLGMSKPLETRCSHHKYRCGTTGFGVWLADMDPALSQYIYFLMHLLASILK